jgi:hypothetical protein
MSKIAGFCAKYDVWLNVIGIAVFTSVFFEYKYFCTLDSAAHSYNANLMWGKLSGGFPQASEFYTWNQEPVPNWLGHFLLLILNGLFSASVAEKILITTYVFAFVFAFRYLIRNYYPEQGWFSLLVIPLAFNAFLYYGFYNFCFSLPVLIWITGFYLRRRGLWKANHYIIFGFLLLLVYFSHMGAFLMVMVFVMIAFITESFVFHKSDYRAIVRHGALLFVASVPVVILASFYFLNRSDGGRFDYQAWSEIYKLFRHLYPTIVYAGNEAKYSTKIMYIFALLSMFIVGYRIWKKSGFIYSDFLLIVSLVMVALTFYLPDGDGKGGFMTLRMVLISYIFFLAWLISNKIPFVVQLLALAPLFVLTSRHLTMFRETQSLMNQVVRSIEKVSDKHVKENDVILPIWRPVDWDWISAHYANYLGVDKNVIVLENYEAAQDYFPLKYNHPQPYTVVFSFQQDYYCERLLPELFKAKQLPGFVLEYGTNINMEYPCEPVIDSFLNAHYILIEDEKYARLHQLR